MRIVEWSEDGHDWRATIHNAGYLDDGLEVEVDGYQIFYSPCYIEHDYAQGMSEEDIKEMAWQIVTEGGWVKVDEAVKRAREELGE